MPAYVNQQYRVKARFEDENGALTDPTTTTFVKQAPDGTQTTVAQASLTHDGTGLWSYVTSESTPGVYTWQGTGTGTVTARDLVRVRIIPGIT